MGTEIKRVESAWRRPSGHSDWSAPLASQPLSCCENLDARNWVVDGPKRREAVPLDGRWDSKSLIPPEWSHCGVILSSEMQFRQDR